MAFAFMIFSTLVGGCFLIPDGGNPTCDPSNADKNKTVCDMIEVIQKGANSLAFLSGFIIAGFVLSAVNLWCISRRTAYCALCGAT